MDRRSFCHLMEEVRCPLCLDFLKIPRVLTCQHSFCTECLVQLYNSSGNNARSIQCPVCRHTTDITNNGDNPIASLSINHLLQNIVTTLSENYESRSPSPENQQQIVPAFPPPSCGVDYSFSALPVRTPSPIIRIQETNNQHCNAAPIDFPLCKVDEQISKWAEKLWFAPSDLLKQINTQKPFDIYVEYLPFYILDFEVSSFCTAFLSSDRVGSIRDDSTTGEKIIEKSAKRSYSHVVCAAKDESVYDLAQEIKDWNPYTAIPNCQVVSPNDFYDWSTVWHLRNVEKTIFRQEETKMRQEFSPEQSIQSVNLRVKYSEVYQTLIYLPVYITYYKYNSQSYTALISAQSGTVSADRPFGLGSAGSVINKIRGWFISN
uniref:RING-type domain-containing protein n=1 Tax=Vannella robusta TaxID=1487602 RepID=A0A7S4I9C6_9EUKA|mmetsp:Transcript_22299/g.28468  ORF Transcript_22299/g.28468 Transcript_22299/m.28468 type:complete len:376 (+) Transcript_22299:36-1163(+)